MTVVATAWAVTSRSSARDLSGFVEYAYGEGTDRRTDPPAPEVERESSFFGQRYNVVWNRQIYENLRLLTGGYFEGLDQQQQLGGLVTDSSITTFRPFVNLLLSSPVWSSELGWDRNEQSTDPGVGAGLTFVRDNYRATFGWEPDRYPLVQLRLLRTDDRDRQRSLRDRDFRTVQLISEYNPRDPVYLYYTGAWRRTEDAINDNTVTDVSHTGRFVYNDSYLNRRALINSDWTGTYRTTDTTTSGTGEISLPVFPFEGLSEIDEFPEQGPLARNAALIDDDFDTSAGIDLGLPPPAGDDRSRNFGLDFADTVEINTLFVWIDRDIPLDTAASFSWRIYTSDDNQEWTLRDSVPAAVFGGAFLPRFEIRFDNVEARYVKLVTEPLQSTDPDAGDFPSIFVTELEAFIRSPAADVEGTRSLFSQIYNLNFRYRITDAPRLFYELGYFLTDTDAGPSSWVLSNGFSVFQRFARIYTLNARYAREEIRDSSVERDANQLTGSLSADPLETVRFSLVYSGREEDSFFGTTEGQSLFLLTVLELYRGVSLNAGFGRSYREIDPGRLTESRQANGTLTMQPHRTLAMTLFWQDRRDDLSGGGLTDERRVTRSTELNAAWRPVQALYLFGAFRVEDRPDVDARTTSRYLFSWAPFRDGTLSLVLNYNETLRSDFDTRETVSSSRIRWQVSGNTFVNLGFAKITQESDLFDSDSSNLSADVRFGF
ncbi:MAG TPA: hypothetical protein VD788_07685 [Candidatus Polarisedimenticolaceae bacterium]|nr:hypothetical protein [Candidatus Polarisedimenticolaceae bacterium]